MKLPGTSIIKQETDLTSYAVKRNFRALLGNPWRMEFELPTIEDVDLSTFTFALLIYDAFGQLVNESRHQYESPVDITLPSSVTEKFVPGIYSYFLIALYGSGNATTNYTIASGIITSIENTTIDGTATMVKTIPSIDDKFDGK